VSWTDRCRLLGLLLFLTGLCWVDPIAGAPLPAPARCKPAWDLPAAKADDFPPPPTGSRGFDVLAYDLDLQLDPSARSISGRVVIRLAAVSVAPEFDPADDLTVVQLDLVPELTVSQVTDSEGDLAFIHTDSRLEITLRRPLAIGVADTLTVAWQGQPPRHGSFLAGLMYRTHDPGTPSVTGDDVPIVANVSQTWSAHSWWPCKDHPADKAQVSLAITVPDTLSAVSNGSLIAVTDPAPGWRRFAWREQYPLPTYLVSIAVSNYVSWSEDCLPDTGPAVRLDFHVFPEDRANAEQDLLLTCEMMTFLTDIIGPWPYPGEKYAQVEIKWIGGMEHTTATSLSQLLFTGDLRQENLFLHEMVHQWFGDSLTPATWSDIWLNEGFARFGEALWVEHRYGLAAYREFMSRIGPQRHPTLFRGDGLLSDPVPILPNLLIYDKGAWVLHMLRQMIGEQAFLTFWRDYAADARYRHGLVTVDDMIAVAETAAGRSLEAFFTPWLETDLAPVISHEVRLPSPGRVELTLIQHQSPIFTIPVPVVLHSDCSDVPVIATLATARQTFIWDLDCPVDSVTVAPGGLALMHSLNSPPPPLVVEGPSPNPVGGAGALFLLFLTKDTEVTVTVYDIRGRQVHSENLGVVPAAGTAEVPLGPGQPWRWIPGDGGGPGPASGRYYFEFKGGGGRDVRQLTYIR